MCFGVKVLKLMFLGGKMSEIKSINPFSGDEVGSYQTHSDEKIQAALKLADSQFHTWKKTDLEGRSKLVVNFGKLLRENIDELAEIATLEMGKPIEQAKAEVNKCADLCDFYAEKASDFLKPKIVSESKPLKMISYQPMGCVLSVMPWNFPYWQVVRFAVPTLLAGNVAILKHASNVSGCALKIEKLLLQAGFAEGVFQTLIVSSDNIEDIIDNRIIKAVSLTGSGPAGSAVAEAAGRNIKKVVLELGGSDPYLILEDADLDKAAEDCVQSRLQNNGQSCIAAKRFIIHESVYDEFKDKLIKLCDQKKYGDPMDASTHVGPLAKVSLAEELSKQVRDSIEGGAKLAYQKECSEGSKAFFPITMLEDIPEKSPAYRDEFFGPVFLLFKFSNLEEGLKIANDSDFGLGGGVFTSNLKLGKEIAETGIDSGSVFVNSFTKSDPEMPFGGIKDSGIGRELSSYGIHEFVNIKTISVSS